jgi:type II secretory pathway component PulJ
MEIVIAMAITALIGSAVATATYQVVRINASSTNRQIAITQVENAVHNISRDAQQAQQVIPQDITGTAKPLDSAPPLTKLISFDLSSGEKLTLTWITWDNHTNVVTYTLANGVLQRTITVDSGVPGTVVVANNIINDGTGGDVSGSWNTETKVLNFTILKATVGTGASRISETRTFQIIPRPAQ